MSDHEYRIASIGPVFPEPTEDRTQYGGSQELFYDAAQAFGVELTPQETYDWRVILGSAMVADHLLDIEKKDIGIAFGNILSGSIRPDLDRDAQVRTVN